MDTKNNFLENLDQQEMDRLLEGMDEADFRIDPAITDRIMARSMEGIRKEQRKSRKRPFLHYAAAALAVMAGLSFASPAVRATMRDLFSFVPGIGAIESEKELFIVRDLSVISGREKILGEPVILADDRGVQLNLQTGDSMERPEGISLLNGFEVSVNGKRLELDPTGYSAGSENHSSYSVYFETPVREGDLVTFSHVRLDYTLEGHLEKLDPQDPGDLPHASAGDILTVAQPVKRAGGWDVYMYAVSDKVTPLSFAESYEFTEPLVFRTPGQTYPVTLPDSYGTGFMPPLKIDGAEGAGELLIPSLSYNMDASAEYTFRIPGKDESYVPQAGFTMAGVPIRVDRIYTWPQEEGGIALDISWDTPGNTSLDFFWVEGESSGLETRPGGMTIILESSFSLTGKRTITLTGADFTLHEEVRIPLDLK